LANFSNLNFESIIIKHYSIYSLISLYNNRKNKISDKKMKKAKIFLCLLLFLSPFSANALESDVFPELVYWSAVRSGELDKVKGFLQNGYNPDKVDGSKLAPIFYAVKVGSPEMIKMLLSYKAKIDIEDPSGNTPLIWSSRFHNLGVIDVLLDFGADINHQNREGTTALMRAIEFGNFFVVKRLLEAKPDLLLQDFAGRDARMLADQGRNKKIQNVMNKLYAD
tara:strand:- start:446 stop:1114 length:669 start_codon:yes stop_codon:yes gene_type:complete